jgi:ribosome-associated protein
LDAKKAADITVLDVERLTVLADYFIVAGGTSNTNVRALAEHVEEKMEELGVSPLRKEGVKDARWVVYDYGSVILHILLDDMRLFYSLEKLWSDGKNFQKYVAEDESDAIEIKTISAEKSVKSKAEKVEKPTKTRTATAKNKAETAEKKTRTTAKTGTEKPTKTRTATAKNKAETAEKKTRTTAKTGTGTTEKPKKTRTITAKNTTKKD